MRMLTKKVVRVTKVLTKKRRRKMAQDQGGLSKTNPPFMMLKQATILPVGTLSTVAPPAVTTGNSIIFSNISIPPLLSSPNKYGRMIPSNTPETL